MSLMTLSRNIKNQEVSLYILTRISLQVGQEVFILLINPTLHFQLYCLILTELRETSQYAQTYIKGIRLMIAFILYADSQSVLKSDSIPVFTFALDKASLTTVS